MNWNFDLYRKFKNGGGATTGDEAFPPALPYPNGWFCLGFSRELAAESTVTRRLMDEDVVLARTADGTLKAIRPYCPHLGAHLGIMGRVRGEDITCRFHNIEFSLDGPCKRTAYNLPPPKANLTTLPVRETGGAIFVWRSQDGEPPSWQLPEIPTAGWQPPLFRTFDIASHPQQVVENIFDTGHQTELHRQPPSAPPEADFNGFTASLTTDMKYSVPTIGELRINARADVYGLGVVVGDFELASPSLRARIYILPTPVGPWRLQYRFASSAAVTPAGPMKGKLGGISASLAARGLRRMLFHMILKDNYDDFAVWQYQKFVEPPRLAKGDGPIGKYRKWSEQFYSQNSQRNTHSAAADNPPGGLGWT
jgi:nitrite reductase/ring-hydroxylating ferredoxin subunit